MRGVAAEAIVFLLCPVVGPVAPCQRELVSRADGRLGESITHVLLPRHHMTASCL